MLSVLRTISYVLGRCSKVYPKFTQFGYVSSHARIDTVSLVTYAVLFKLWENDFDVFPGFSTFQTFFLNSTSLRGFSCHIAEVRARQLLILLGVSKKSKSSKRVHCFSLELFSLSVFRWKIINFSLEIDNFMVFRWKSKLFYVRSGSGFSLEVIWFFVANTTNFRWK